MAVAVFISYMCQVTPDTRHQTPGPDNTYIHSFFFVSARLFTHIEKFSVTCVRSFLEVTI